MKPRCPVLGWNLSAVQLWDCLGDGQNKQTNQWYELIRDDFLPRPINQ